MIMDLKALILILTMSFDFGAGGEVSFELGLSD
jgi:hypothetical protein